MVCELRVGGELPNFFRQDAPNFNDGLHALIRNLKVVRVVENSTIFQKRKHTPGNDILRFRRIPGYAENWDAEASDPTQYLFELHRWPGNG